MGNRNSTTSNTDSDTQLVVRTEQPPEGATQTQDKVDKWTKIRGLARVLRTTDQRKKDCFRGQHDFHRENMQLLKHLFKKMDPSIMKMAAYKSRGEVQLSFKYEPTRELLLIKVIQCKDLDAKDLRGKASDPYVTLQLYPFEEDQQEPRKTKIARNTLDPVYHEIFAFPITDSQLQESQLIVQVWDHDIMDKDDLIGETLVPLESFDWSVEPVQVAWYSLRAETDLNITGDLEVTLMFRLPDTLIVKVHRGNHLTNRYQEGAPNPFVKLQVPGLALIHETEVKYDTVNPEWEQAFQFPVAPEEFASRYLVLHAIDYDDGGKNESLGQIVIELSNFDFDEGFHGALELTDLKNSDRLRAKWFQHAAIQELRESLVAHAAFHYPQFLFSKQEGTKVIRVRSRKAGTEARLRIVNGIPVY